MHTVATFAWIFGLMFILEFPDKTMFATMIMAAKARPLPIWIGGSLAFTLHMAIAVLAGGVMRLLPTTLREVVIMLLFFGGAAYLFFVTENEAAAEGAEEARRERARGAVGQAFAAFGVIFVGEIGDLTQIQAANLVAKLHQYLLIFSASSLALISVCAIGSFAGGAITRWIPLERLRIGGGLIFVAFGVWTLVGLIA